MTYDGPLDERCDGEGGCGALLDACRCPDEPDGDDTEGMLDYAALPSRFYFDKTTEITYPKGTP